MSEYGTPAKISVKKSTLILVFVAVFVLSAVIGAIAGYDAYRDATMTDITNLNQFFKDDSGIYIYEYSDDTVTINIDKIVSVSKNATLNVQNVKVKNSNAELEIIDNSGDKAIDVTDKTAKYVNLEVNNSFKSKEYTVILVAEKNKNNTIYTENVELDNGFLDIYSTENDYILPSPIKTYTSDDVTFNFDFLGWYTTPDFAEESKIEIIPQGSSGSIELYARFKSTSYEVKDGIHYYTMGEYPQSVVKNYNTVKILKTLTPTNGIVEYNSKKYYKFTPPNVSNVSSNGYSTSTAYYFEVEPIVWRILTTSTPVSGTQYMLFADKILNNSMFVNKTAESLYENIPESYRQKLEEDTSLLNKLMKSFYDPESLWYKSEAKEKLDSIYNSSLWFTSTEKSEFVKRSYTAYYTDIVLWPLSDFNIDIASERTGEDYLYCLQYSELYDANYGFNSDPLAYDPARQANVTDFALANGAYVIEKTGYDKVGSYFMRGAGDKYDYEDRRFGYVKYTGAIHCYAAKNWNIQSGIRPCCKVTVNF